MPHFTVVLVYATWVAAPLIVHSALMAGLARSGRRFAVIFALYSGAVLLTWLGVRADLAQAGAGAAGAVSAGGVALAWLGTGVLSGAMHALGRRVG